VRFGRKGQKRFGLVGLVLSAGCTYAVSGEACFLRDGDVWVFHGDSITHADTYRRLCERVFRHYHPEARAEFIQAGVWGSTSSDLVKKIKEEGRKPAVVSLMLGMNNAINGAWIKGQPRGPHLEAYRRDISEFVRKYKAEGAAVILLSPTLADETVRRTVFRIEGANEFLRDCGRIVKEVAAAEGACYVPAQAEFEAFQETLDPAQRLRPDGVHPASLGEYQIARTLWERLNFAGSLGPGPRALSEPAPRLPVNLRLATRFLAPDASGLAFTIEPSGGAGAPPKLAASWSLGEQHGTAEFETAAKSWTLTPPKGLPALKAGGAADAVIELKAGDRSALFVVDLCAVPVLHFKDNAISGAIDSAADRPEGRRVAAWTLRRNGGELLLEVEVTDSKLDSASEWAWGRDGLNLFWDLRPAERFADINLDADVHQTLVNVQDQPFFAVALRPWLGAGMEYAATAGGERTTTGYRVRFRLNQGFGLHRPLALEQRDFIGLSIIVVDADGGQTAFHEAIPPQRPHDQYANNLPILDLKAKLTGDSVHDAHVFPPPAHPPGNGPTEGRP